MVGLNFNFRNQLQLLEMSGMDGVLRSLSTTFEFDYKLKKFFLNDLTDTINCNRAFCPTCFADRTNST